MIDFPINPNSSRVQIHELNNRANTAGPDLVQAIRPRGTAVSTGAFVRSIRSRISSAEANQYAQWQTQSQKNSSAIHIAGHKMFNAHLDKEHPVQQEMESLLNETAQKLGIDPKEVSISIFKSGESIGSEDLGYVALNLPDAFIHPQNGHISISNTMLEAMDYRVDLLRAVIAHELGHFITAQRSKDEIETFDPLENKITKYEEEYYSDRVASIANSLFGEDTTAISEVLTRLEDAVKAFKNEHGFNSHDDTEIFGAFLTRSHPYSKRRIKANSRLARMLGKKTNDTTLFLENKLTAEDFSQTLYEKWINLLKRGKADSNDYNYKAEQVKENIGAESINPELKARENYQARELEDYKEIIFNALVNSKHTQKKLGELSLKNTITSLETLDEFLNQRTSDPKILDQKATLRKIFIQSSEDYLPEAEAVDINNLVSEGLDADSKQEFHDFFTELALYFCFHDGHKLEALEETMALIENLSQESLEEFLQSFTIKDLLSNTCDCSTSSIYDEGFIINSDLLSNMLVDQWVSGCEKKGMSQIDILKGYFSLVTENEKNNGPNLILKHTSSMAEILNEVFSQANDSDKKTVIELLNSNPSLSQNLVSYYNDHHRMDPRKNQLLKDINKFCQKEKLYSVFNFKEEHRSDFDKEINKTSNIRRKILMLTPHLMLNLNKNAAGFSFETNWQGPNCEINIGYSDINELDKELLEKKLRETLAEKGETYENLFETANEDKKYSKARDFDGHIWVFDIQKLAKEIDRNTLTSLEDKKTFLKETLAGLEQGSLSQKIITARNASLSDARDQFLGMSEDDFILIHGQEKYISEYYAIGRNQYDAKDYSDIENELYSLTQIWHMWNEAFADEFDSMQASAEKLDFLLETQPILSLSRDQKIVEAINYPELNTWQDTAKVKKALEAETDHNLLVKLRDSFINPVLINACQIELYKKIDQNLNLKESDEIENLLNEEPSFKSDNELMRILLSLNTKSSLRDEFLKPIIDRQNSARKKELISRLTTQPTTINLKEQNSMSATAQSETFLDSLAKFSPRDKAEVLLYFLGKRDFQSIDLIESDYLAGATSKILGYDDEAKKAGFTTRKEYLDRFLNHAATYVVDNDMMDIGITELATLIKYRKPDALVRLLKVIGMDDDVLQDTLDSVSSNKEQIEALAEILSADNGILNDSSSRKFFFKEAAETIVNNSTSNLGDKKQKKAIQGLIEFTLQECPSEKLPGMFKNLWNLSRTKNLTLAELSSEILQKLGPAFIKFGQKLATMNIPTDFKAAFRRLSSQNTVADTTFFYHYLQANGLGDHFEETESGAKIGEGSMAASYKAKALANTAAELKSAPQSLERAVKIIHPFIEAEIDQDIEFIRKLVGYINDHSKDFNGLTIPENTPEIIKQRLIEQTKPELEIKKAQIMADNLQADYGNLQFQAVKIDHERSKGLVITSHYRPGLELDNPKIDEAGLNGQEIRNKVGIELLRQILQADAYQSDPNLGNFGLMVNSDGAPELDAKSRAQVVWYDSGAIENISKDDQKTLLSLIKAIATQSKDLPKILSTLIDSNEDLSSEIRIWLNSLSVNTEKSSFENAKLIFESFIDFSNTKGHKIHDKWISLADTLGMLSPLLEGAKPDLISGLIKESLIKSGLLNTKEKLALIFLKV